MKRRINIDATVSVAIQVVGLAFLSYFLVLPLFSMFRKSVQDADGKFIGLHNYISYFSTQSLIESVFHSFWISICVACIVVPVSFIFAYALTRTVIPGKHVFKAISQIPVLAPSLLPSLSLIYLFGNQGILKGLLFGKSIYGPLGIIIAQAFFNLPQAIMILVASLSITDQRLYESARVLGTGKFRIWKTIILPEAKFGIVSSFFIVFAKAITDFGSVIVIGGSYNVLSTDIYKQVIGQQNFQMGAVIGVILLIPAFIGFIGNRIVSRNQRNAMSAQSVPMVPERVAVRDSILFIFVTLICLMLLGILAVAIWGSFITYWPYNFSPTLKHYNFSAFDPGGWSPLYNSMKLSLLAALIGTGLVFLEAYIGERGRGRKDLSSLFNFFALIPLAVPGLVLGLSYVVFFNARKGLISNLNGTILLMAFSTIVHYYSVCHLSAVAAIQKLDKEFETISESLHVSIFRTFFKVTIPISIPVIMDIFSYLFFAAMSSVSVLIFLYVPSTRLATIAAVNISDSGRTGSAAAMALSIVGVCLVFKILHSVAAWYFSKRNQEWLKR